MLVICCKSVTKFCKLADSNPANPRKGIPKSKEFIEKYLTSTPEPIPPLKAFSIGMLVNFEMFSGNNAEAEKLIEEAKALDPYFSHAFGLPSLSIFEQPDKLDHHFQSFFSPY